VPNEPPPAFRSWARRLPHAERAACKGGKA